MECDRQSKKAHSPQSSGIISTCLSTCFIMSLTLSTPVLMGPYSLLLFKLNRLSQEVDVFREEHTISVEPTYKDSGSRGNGSVSAHIDYTAVEESVIHWHEAFRELQRRIDRDSKSVVSSFLKETPRKNVGTEECCKCNTPPTSSRRSQTTSVDDETDETLSAQERSSSKFHEGMRSTKIEEAQLSTSGDASKPENDSLMHSSTMDNSSVLGNDSFGSSTQEGNSSEVENVVDYEGSNIRVISASNDDDYDETDNANSSQASQEGFGNEIVGPLGNDDHNQTDLRETKNNSSGEMQSDVSESGASFEDVGEEAPNKRVTETQTSDKELFSEAMSERNRTKTNASESEIPYNMLGLTKSPRRGLVADLVQAGINSSNATNAIKQSDSNVGQSMDMLGGGMSTVLRGDYGILPNASASPKQNMSDDSGFTPKSDVLRGDYGILSNASASPKQNTSDCNGFTPKSLVIPNPLLPERPGICRREDNNLETESVAQTTNCTRHPLYGVKYLANGSFIYTYDFGIHEETSPALEEKGDILSRIRHIKERHSNLTASKSDSEEQTNTTSSEQENENIPIAEANFALKDVDALLRQLSQRFSGLEWSTLDQCSFKIKNSVRHLLDFLIRISSSSNVEDVSGPEYLGALFLINAAFFLFSYSSNSRLLGLLGWLFNLITLLPFHQAYLLNMDVQAALQDLREVQANSISSLLNTEEHLQQSSLLYKIHVIVSYWEHQPLGIHMSFPILGSLKISGTVPLVVTICNFGLLLFKLADTSNGATTVGDNRDTSKLTDATEYPSVSMLPTGFGPIPEPIRSVDSHMDHSADGTHGLTSNALYPSTDLNDPVSKEQYPPMEYNQVPAATDNLQENEAPTFSSYNLGPSEQQSPAYSWYDVNQSSTSWGEAGGAQPFDNHDFGWDTSEVHPPPPQNELSAAPQDIPQEARSGDIRSAGTVYAHGGSEVGKDTYQLNGNDSFGEGTAYQSNDQVWGAQVAGEMEPVDQHFVYHQDSPETGPSVYEDKTYSQHNLASEEYEFPDTQVTSSVDASNADIQSQVTHGGASGVSTVGTDIYGTGENREREDAGDTNETTHTDADGPTNQGAPAPPMFFNPSQAPAGRKVSTPQAKPRIRPQSTQNVRRGPPGRKKPHS